MRGPKWDNIPHFTGITIHNYHYVSSAVAPSVILLGYDPMHLTEVTLDNVILDGIAAVDVTASNAAATLGPGNVNFVPTGKNVTVDAGIVDGSVPYSCAGRWVTF